MVIASWQSRVLLGAVRDMGEKSSPYVKLKCKVAHHLCSVLQVLRP